jgi:hypothetical protein
MAINFAKMKQKLDKLNDPKSGSNNLPKTVIKLTPRPEEYILRILPDVDGDPFKEFFFHYIPKVVDGKFVIANGKKQVETFMCPKRSRGEECSCCKLVKDLFDTKNEIDRVEAKEIMAKARYYSIALMRDSEEFSDTPGIWSYPKTAYKSLMTLVLDSDYGDITDPNEGFDLKVVFDKEKGKMYPDTKVSAKRKSSKIHQKLSASELLEKAPSLDEYVKVSTPQEVEEALNRYLECKANGGEETEESEDIDSGDPESKAVDDALNAVLGD